MIFSQIGNPVAIIWGPRRRTQVAGDCKVVDARVNTSTKNLLLLLHPDKLRQEWKGAGTYFAQRLFSHAESIVGRTKAAERGEETREEVAKANRIIIREARRALKRFRDEGLCEIISEERVYIFCFY